jgi:isoleucyl-tRNA synthetase
VHLTDYPVAERSLVDPNLEAAMAMARSLVSLGRMVRTDAKVRVRQPLSHALVHVPGDPSALDPVLSLVAEELNVRDVHFAGSADELASWRAKPNFRALGPRLGRQVQEVAAALAQDDGSLAAGLARGGSVDLRLSSGAVTLDPQDVELVQQDRPGWAMAADGPLAVALELELTPDLRREGLARELVHHLQALRRTSGLELTDRVEVAVETDPRSEVAAAVQEQGSRIAGDVLAVAIVGGPLEGGASERMALDGSEVTIWLRRVPTVAGG